MTPAEYLRFVASAKGIPQREQSGQMDRVMDKTGIREVRNRLIWNLRRFSKMRRFLVSTLKMRRFASIHKFRWFVSKLTGFFRHRDQAAVFIQFPVLVFFAVEAEEVILLAAPQPGKELQRAFRILTNADPLLSEIHSKYILPIDIVGEW